MKQFETEKIKIHPENPYLKVHVNIPEDMNRLRDFTESLTSVNHTNITENRAGTRDSLTVYPMKTFSIEEVKRDIDMNLSNYFQNKK
ncbi:hypothetical protein [uncultured Parabacteroides sp.]|uniref:hypothetical protein n=1 Tax=uncultured Parabacteroides sp. TaxID=512312 RepID=UPI00259B4B0C|nr:hypothetical protein [uncultured Parabacteroides sp.]